MGSSKVNATLALFLLLNIIFFTFVNACDTCPNPKPKPKPKPKPTPKACPPPPSSTTTPPPSSTATCPRDALKLGVCADLLGGLLNIVIVSPSKQPCCSLIQGLADLEAAVCLCTAIKANILGINLNVPLSLSLLLNVCGNKIPKGFQCA